MSEPKKAGSLIIARPVQPTAENNYFDYEILLLIRNKSMTFANNVAYPGGKIEPQDAEFLNKNAQSLGLDPKTAGKSFHNLFKISSVRETYEETGLFFAKEKLNPNQDKIRKILSSCQATNTQPDFYSLAQDLGIAFENELIEFMRFVTPFVFKFRFDAQFFVYKMDPDCVFNISAGLQNSNDIHSTAKLAINTGESSAYTWLNPAQTMAKHNSKEFELAPPQVLITNILMSFKKFDDLLNYLKIFRQGVQKDSNGEFPKSYPLTFPLTPFFSKAVDEDMKKQGFDLILIFPYDSKYPQKKALESEQSQSWREELEAYYSSTPIAPGTKCRIYYKSSFGIRHGESQISSELNTLIKHVKSSSADQALFNKPSL